MYVIFILLYMSPRHKAMQGNYSQNQFPFSGEKEELPEVGLEPATFFVLGRYQLSYQRSPAGQAESIKC